MTEVSARYRAAMAASNANQAGRALQLMEKCAEEGDPAACYMTALWYREGEGAPVNEQRSAHWIARLVELAEQGNLKAQWEVEQSYRFGNLLPYDIERANAWMERAASGGCGKEQHQLGWSYEHGQNGYPVDLAKATMWYQRAFEQEHPETLYLFAIRQFVDGKPTPEAIRLLKKAAARGFSQAETVLDPHPPRRRKAERSAKIRSALDAYDADELESALQLMEESAKEGDPVACYDTALWYRDGKGVSADPERSAQWIARLAELAEEGGVEAQRNLEFCYRYGDVLPRNIERANHWLERAAAAGCAEAQTDLALYNESGMYGYPANPDQAAKWRQRAFDQGHPDALYEVAIGRFVGGQPTEQALALLRKAADGGVERARYLLQAYSP